MDPILLKSLAAAAEELPKGEPICMVNLLRFVKDSDYKDDDGRPLSGRQAWEKHYVGAFGKMAAELVKPGQVERLYYGTMHPSIVDREDSIAWDAIAVIKYESFDVFRAIVDSEQYRKTAFPHRLKLLEKWELYPTSPAST